MATQASSLPASASSLSLCLASDAARERGRNRKIPPKSPPSSQVVQKREEQQRQHWRCHHGFDSVSAPTASQLRGRAAACRCRSCKGGREERLGIPSAAVGVTPNYFRSRFCGWMRDADGSAQQTGELGWQGWQGLQAGALLGCCDDVGMAGKLTARASSTRLAPSTAAVYESPTCMYAGPSDEPGMQQRRDRPALLTLPSSPVDANCKLRTNAVAPHMHASSITPSLSLSDSSRLGSFLLASLHANLLLRVIGALF